MAERHLTPARAVAAVAMVACAALAASQWLDYRSVSVGIDAYAGEVGAIAPPPEVESEIAGNAHAWVMVPLAVAAWSRSVSRSPASAGWRSCWSRSGSR